jgi:hypothetical protein
MRHREDVIRRGPVSAAAATKGRCYLLLLSLKTECHKSADNDSSLAPSIELVDPNPTITTVDPRAQVLADIDSTLDDILNYFTENLDSLTEEQQVYIANEIFRYFTCVMSYYIPHFNGW